MEVDVNAQLEELARFFDEPPASGQLIFGTKNGSETELSSAKLLRQTVGSYAEHYAAKIREYKDEEWSDYDSEEVEPGSFRHLSAKEVPNAKSYLARSIAPLRNLDHEFIESIKYTEFRFENSRGRVCSVFKVYQKSKFLAPGNRFKFVWTDPVLTPIEKSLIVAPPNIDCVLFNGRIFVIEWSPFETIFDYQEYLQAAGERVFETLAQRKDFSINGLEEIKAKCMDKPRNRRKLAHISRTAPLQNVSFDELVGFCKDKKLTDPVVDVAKRSLTFKTSRAFLHLFGDDYVSSGLTLTDYVATSKRRMVGNGS